MRPTTTWLLGCVLAGALEGCSGDPAAGPCVRQSDCGDGQRCHPGLGCVPLGNGAGDADSDSDSAADGGAEECEAGRQQDCLLPDDCDSLWMLCDQGDREACAALEAGACEADRCRMEDDACDPQCPADDPDCSALGCSELCGPPPETAGDSCAWDCSEGEDCVLRATDPGAPESCEAVDAPGPRDEDCDGLADCDDPDCAGWAGCQ